MKDESRLRALLERSDPAGLVELSRLVNFLSVKLTSLSSVEDMVNTIDKPEEGEMFCMELAGLLRELCKPVFCEDMLIEVFFNCPLDCIFKIVHTLVSWKDHP